MTETYKLGQPENRHPINARGLTEVAKIYPTIVF